MQNRQGHTKIKATISRPLILNTPVLSQEALKTSCTTTELNNMFLSALTAMEINECLERLR